MIHNFEQSLIDEKKLSTRADKFYREVLNVSDIKRFNSDSESDMEMQRQDIDLLLTLKEITYRVSEKFRDKDFGDLYIEVFSKYPQTPGWLISGTPNAILYFTPFSVYWITHLSLKNFCQKTLLPAIPENYYSKIFKSGKTIISEKIKMNDEIYDINIIQAHNHPTEGSNWETIGISIPFEVLEKFNVKLLKFDYRF